MASKASMDTMPHPQFAAEITFKEIHTHEFVVYYHKQTLTLGTHTSRPDVQILHSLQGRTSTAHQCSPSSLCRLS